LLTARSGRNGVSSRLKHLGHDLSAKEMDVFIEKFKALADKKKYVFDDDLIALLDEGRPRGQNDFALDYMSVTSGTGIVPTATVRLKKGDAVIQEAACGDGPVDAAYKAMDKIVGFSPKLLDYRLQSVSAGQDAQGEVSVRAERKGVVVSAKGTSTDVVEASAKAYLSALNKLTGNKRAEDKKVKGDL
jgi:2-isopropylmalate synthase